VALIQQIEQVAPASTGLDATVEAEVLKRRRVSDGTPQTQVVFAGATAAVAAPVRATETVASLGAAAPANGVAAAPQPAAGGIAANGAARRIFCTNCGAAMEAHHRFCAACGAPATAPAAVQVSAPH
jgi:membrane protease subunit (stomatin/prohibitin family)